MNRYRVIAIALIAALAGFVLYPLYRPSGKEKGSVAVNASGDGLSLAYAFLRERHAGKVRFKRTPFLDTSDIAGASTILILSPKMPLSVRESKILLEWVRRGGTLLLSAHDQNSLASAWAIGGIFGLSPATHANPGYRSGNFQLVANKEDGKFIKAGETYAFYSRVTLSDQCDLPAMYCFHENFPVGQGRVVFWLGLAPIANGLVEWGDNLNVLGRMLDAEGPVIIDEFHHLFSDYTFKDLLARPEFLISILSFFVAGVLYMAFARAPEVDVIRAENDESGSLRRLSFYKLYENVFRRQLGENATGTEALLQHARWFERIVPDRATDIAEFISHRKPGATLLDQARRLVLMHKNHLDRKKGVKP